MRRSYFRLLEGVLLSLPLLFASCGNGDNALEEIINGGGSGGSGGGSTSTNTYLKWNGSDYDTPEIPSTAIDASTITTTINAGFYDVKSDVNLSGTITLAGDAEFVLRDGATLKISGAIVDMTETYNLTIYAQSEGTGMGKLDITSTSTTDYPISANKLTVHGGEIIASNTGGTAVNLAGGLDVLGGKLTASSDGVAIMVYGGIINVVKGTIDAQTSGNGISAFYTYGVDMIVLGGTVKATTSGDGGSCIEVGGDFTVYDGEIDAQATGDSYGINASGVLKKFTVSGGTITAKSGAGGMAAINVANEMEVNDGIINATGGVSGEGILVQNLLTIYDGTIEANGGANANGLEGPSISIKGGTVTAIGGDAPASSDSKGGDGVNGGLSVQGGTLTATGGKGEGTGNGGHGINANTIISNCVLVTATGGSGGGGTLPSAGAGVSGTLDFDTSLSAAGSPDNWAYTYVLTSGKNYDGSNAPADPKYPWVRVRPNS